MVYPAYLPYELVQDFWTINSMSLWNPQKNHLLSLDIQIPPEKEEGKFPNDVYLLVPGAL